MVWGGITKGWARKSWVEPGTVAEVVRVTQNELPDDGSTHWSTRRLADRVGVGKDTVARICATMNLPWQVDRFKISDDPRFEEKLVDVVGLYLNPPQRAVVFAFDELCEASHNSSNVKSSVM